MIPQYQDSLGGKENVSWGVVILIFAGILIMIVLITIFFVMPNYVTGYIDDKFLGSINGLNNNSDSGSLGIKINCEEDVYNCSNFTTQAESQQVFDACISDGEGDIHQLDGDGNQRACEGLE